MYETVSQARWDAQPSQLGVTDKITVRNLQVTVNTGVDVWGRQKKQPALITVTLCLARPFDSAAAADALDGSTVNYGLLSKNIRGFAESCDSVWKSTAMVADGIRIMALQTAGTTVVRSVQVDVFYPKGSMLGDGAGFCYSNSGREPTVVSRVLYVRNVRIPCLIGVNSNERTQKQPVVASVWVECVPESCSDKYHHLEAAMVEAISNSAFETLESLSTMVVQELRDKVLTGEEEQNAHIRLRVEKPLAVPFAEAPVIEIYRPVRG